MKRRGISSKFKTKVVLEALSGRYTIQQLARKYELDANQISKWKAHFFENAEPVFDKEDTSNGGSYSIYGQYTEYYRYSKPEYIDLPDFPIEKKVKIIQGLDLKNRLFRTYHKMFRYLEPLVKEVNEKEKRPFKILELAGGLGDLSIGLYKEYVNQGKELNISIHGSDIVPEYINIAQEKARSNNANVEFKVIDALEINPNEEKEYDLVVTLHSIHHFSPQSLFLLIQKSQSIAQYGLFAVDGKRSLGNFLFMIGTALMPTVLQFNSMYVHDAFISGINMYSQSFLRKLAKLATPDSKVVCESLSLGLTYLRVSPNNCD